MRHLVLVGVLALWPPLAHANDPSPAEAVGLAEPPAGPPPSAEEVEALTLAISSQLRCPVCQGLSVADSPSETAVTMKGRVRELVAAGYSEAQIRDYFVGRYGEWVLLSPPSNGLARVLWASPVLGLLIAAGAVAWVVRRPRDAAGASRENANVPPDAVDDPYRQRLLAEAEAE